ncbi:MAG: hypothetical protein Q7U30_13020 [Methylicorpusculum sp.]|nr:hypothetical protein [Methylicorpusculum sp.]
MAWATHPASGFLGRVAITARRRTDSTAMAPGMTVVANSFSGIA